MTTIAVDGNGWHVVAGDRITSSDVEPGLGLCWLLEGAARVFGASGDGVLILPEVAARAAGYPPAPGRDDLTRLGAGPWVCERVGAWSRFRRNAGQPCVRVCVAEWTWERHRAANPLLDPRDLVATAARHEWFLNLVGTRFAYSAGGTFCDDVVRHARHGHGRRPVWRDPAMTGLVDGSPSVAMWSWRVLGRPVNMWVHQWDKNASFLGSLGCAEVATGKLTHTRQAGFSPEVAGMWRVIPGPAPVRGLPHPAGSRLPPGEPVWLPTATMRLLDELGCCPDVLDSWTCGDRHRLFKPTAARWNAARLELRGTPDPDGRAVAAAVKAGYAAGVNQLGTPREFIVRPDWRAEVIGLDKATIWRTAHRALRAGWHPLEFRADALFFAHSSEHPEPPPGLRVHQSALGAWKHAGAVPSAKWREGGQ